MAVLAAVKEYPLCRSKVRGENAKGSISGCSPLRCMKVQFRYIICNLSAKDYSVNFGRPPFLPFSRDAAAFLGDVQEPRAAAAAEMP